MYCGGGMVWECVSFHSRWTHTQPAQPVLYDPAVYHGERESGFAVTEMFSGFRIASIKLTMLPTHAMLDTRCAGIYTRSIMCSITSISLVVAMVIKPGNNYNASK